jgi:hypothetical protein
VSATPVPAQVRHRVPKHLEIAASAAEIAVEAGALIRGYFERGVATEYKGDVDLVTEADRTSEKLITERLTAAFPDHGSLRRRRRAAAHRPANIAGMSIRWTERRISRTDFRYSASHLAWSIARKAWPSVRRAR